MGWPMTFFFSIVISKDFEVNVCFKEIGLPPITGWPLTLSLHTYQQILKLIVIFFFKEIGLRQAIDPLFPYTYQQILKLAGFFFQIRRSTFLQAGH